MSEENGQLMQSIILKNEERSWDAPGDSRVEVLRLAALWFTDQQKGRSIIGLGPLFHTTVTS